jgi:hypothetical protein
MKHLPLIIIALSILAVIFTVALCKAAGRMSRLEEELKEKEANRGQK